MTAKTSFRGSFTALVTPFKNGSVDEKAFRDIVDWQISEGTNGLVPVGTTGESPTLSHDEHKQVVEWCIDQADGRVPVIAGSGSNSTAEAIELSRHAEEAGAERAHRLAAHAPECDTIARLGGEIGESDFVIYMNNLGLPHPKLMEVARNNRNPEVRKQAMFWLGQSRDPRALALFEESGFAFQAARTLRYLGDERAAVSTRREVALDYVNR